MCIPSHAGSHVLLLCLVICAKSNVFYIPLNSCRMCANDEFVFYIWLKSEPWQPGFLVKFSIGLSIEYAQDKHKKIKGKWLTKFPWKLIAKTVYASLCVQPELHLKYILMMTGRLSNKTIK